MMRRMRHVRRLIPYAMASLLVVTGSVVVLGLAVSDLRDAKRAAVDRAEPTAAPAVRAFPELSRTGRLAYWRIDTQGGGELLVSNVDGTLRRALAREDDVRRVSLTRWLPDASGVAWVSGASTLVLARLDGTRAELPLPEEERERSSRIASHTWSPDGSRVAASVVRVDLRSDVYIADTAQRTWARATDLEDVFVAEWLDEDRLMVQTGGGVIGVLTAEGVNAIRPLTGLSATSPIFADDGRIHFLSGSVSSTPRDLARAYLTATNATIWSIEADGSGLRRETNEPLTDVRLDARYGQGRYLAHRATSQLQLLLGDGLTRPPSDAGAVERAIVAPDGRSAIGFAGSRIVRFRVEPATDPMQAVRQALSGNFTAPTVMLDSVRSGDVWHPRVTPGTPAPPPAGAGRPAARYAFTLGGRLWLMDPDGTASFLRAGASGSGRRPALTPLWSPSGDRLLTLELAGPGLEGVTAATPLAVTVDLKGDVTPYLPSRAATGTPTWSPAGDAFAVVVDRRGVDGASGLAELELRFLGLDGNAVRPPMTANEGIWLRSGVLVVTQSAIELVADDGSRRPVGDLRSTLAQLELPAEPVATAYSLGAAPDASYFTLRVTAAPRVGRSQSAIALVRAADGAILWKVLDGSQIQDVSWSPTRAVVGYTVQDLALVVDPVNGRTADRPGRFAGWSPDGDWYYIAQPEGLFAHPLAGGEPVRISSVGVPVSVTAP